MAQQGQGSLTDLAAPQLFPGTWGGQLWGTVSVWLHPSVPGLRTGRFVQSQEMAVLPKVRVCETDTFFFLFLLFPLLGSFFYSLLPPHPTLSLGLFQEQPWCHSLPPKAQRASFTGPLAAQDTKKLN